MAADGATTGLLTASREQQAAAGMQAAAGAFA